MVTKITVPEGQGAPPPVELANAPAPSPDAAAQAALAKAAEVQSARVSLAAQAAPKPAVSAAPVTVPSSPSIVTPPVVPAGTPPEIAEEPDFLDGLSKYFTKAKAEGNSTIGASFSTLVHAIGNGIDKISGWFGLKKRGKNIAVAAIEEELPHYRTGDETYAPDDPETKNLVGSAEKQLNIALEKNPTWLDFAQEAAGKFKIPVPILFAFARFESAFNPNAVNGTVAGLGQFWGPTWQRFMAENPEFKGASRMDPRASFCAMAWYARKNAKECGIDASAPDAAARFYEAHHEGAGGFAQLQAFRRGEITGKQRIPKTYLGKSFPKFGVPIVDTYENYVKLVTAMSAKVQAVADLYSTVLPSNSTQQPIS